MPRPTKPKLSELAKIAVQALEDLKGQDIKVLDVQKLTTVTDTMVMCTGTSNRHVKSLAQNVWRDAKEAGFPPLGIEGEDAGEWVLVDLGGVVVHVMQAQARVHYQLEKLWTVEDDLPVVESRTKKAPAKAAKKATRARGDKGAKAAKGGAKAATAGKRAPARKAAKKVAKKVAKKAAGKAAARSTARTPARKTAAVKKTVRKSKPGSR